MFTEAPLPSPPRGVDYPGAPPPGPPRDPVSFTPNQTSYHVGPLFGPLGGGDGTIPVVWDSTLSTFSSGHRVPVHRLPPSHPREDTLPGTGGSVPARGPEVTGRRGEGGVSVEEGGETDVVLRRDVETSEPEVGDEEA